MPDFEPLNQPDSAYEEAGRKAYRMRIDINGNPHKNPKHRDLWEKGWRKARKEEEDTHPQNKRPPFKDDRNNQRQPRPQERRRQNNAPQQNTTKPVANTTTLVARFNRRNRTVV